jgi:hypothetical protein
MAVGEYHLLEVSWADTLLDCVASAGAASTWLGAGNHYLSNIATGKGCKGSRSKGIVGRSDCRGGKGKEGEDGAGDHVER